MSMCGVENEVDVRQRGTVMPLMARESAACKRRTTSETEAGTQPGKRPSSSRTEASLDCLLAQTTSEASTTLLAARSVEIRGPNTTASARLCLATLSRSSDDWWLSSEWTRCRARLRGPTR
jgi:hypothetical protein